MSAGSDKEIKPGLPPILKDLGARAMQRHKQRSAIPEIEIASNADGWTFQSPYSDADLDAWEALLFDAFATRSNAAFHAFTCQLAQLCSTEWQGEEKGWVPSSWELRAAIQTVRSTKPKNEAQACLAAQMVAVHLMQMKLAAAALKYSCPDPRTCAVAGKLARTYAMQLETMAKLKGAGSRQRITVQKHSRHEHKHIHLHPGENEKGNQPHGPRSEGLPEIKAALAIEGCTSLPRENPSRESVPVPGNEGEGTLSTSRRSRGNGRASG